MRTEGRPLPRIEFVLELNPVPWSAPVVVRGKGGSIRTIKPGASDNYQKAVAVETKALIEADLIDSMTLSMLYEMNLDIYFRFWRSTSGGKPADTTNMIKSTEDGLERIIFANDNQNVAVSGCTVEQGPDVEPLVAVRIVGRVQSHGDIDSRPQPTRGLRPVVAPTQRDSSDIPDF